MMEELVEILIETDIDESLFDAEIARDCLLFAMRALNISGASISLRVIDRKTIEEINRKYRGKNDSTDILSFPQYEDIADLQGDLSSGVPVHLGDMVLCLDEMQENCREFGVPAFEELPRLLIHGMLHCAGIHHTSYLDDDPMLKQQELLLKQFLESRSDTNR